MAEMTRPPVQHSADTTPALRGPARSSQPPHSAADEPSSTKNSVYIHTRLERRQSQVVVNSWSTMPESFGQAADSVPPSDFDSGSQNTEKP